MEIANEKHIIIMAGGKGSRFWPMSLPEAPKQFVDVMGVGFTMLQLTVKRFLSICPIENIWIVTGERYVDIVKQQVPELPLDNILAEPEPRNTAPCIGYACWKIHKKFPHANIVVTPSDSLIVDNESYRDIIKEALTFTENNKSIVTIGIKPNRPETGYGYILSESNSICSPLYKVVAFKEKPTLSTAIEYLTAGNYLWNSGVFIGKCSTLMDAFRKNLPDLSRIIDRMSEDFFTEKEPETVKQLFPLCENISIDYGIMEKSDIIYTIAGNFGWSDLGTWGSLQNLLPKDEDSNAVVGKDVSMFNCNNCVVHIASGQKVILEGLNGYIVAERDGKLLVCRLSEEQQIKKFGV